MPFCDPGDLTSSVDGASEMLAPSPAQHGNAVWYDSPLPAPLLSSRTTLYVNKRCILSPVVGRAKRALLPTPFA
ncbi:hypothetical protein NP233_g1015 [Leucocoprinus birnbaumii]|uniref:Uncharacterized protein n=1 Tax=Leucocoprinus birnbaumii TaxID=56174 RepID=A0AAD5W3L8_9AGAR|nr:hypothetical protein NP233_g1015 [Leucocoprinus birnbaumii]